MKQIAPMAPDRRKIVLPSIIRISDANFQISGKAASLAAEAASLAAKPLSLAAKAASLGHWRQSRVISH